MREKKAEERSNIVSRILDASSSNINIEQKCHQQIKIAVVAIGFDLQATHSVDGCVCFSLSMTLFCVSCNGKHFIHPPMKYIYIGHCFRSMSPTFLFYFCSDGKSIKRFHIFELLCIRQFKRCNLIKIDEMCKLDSKLLTNSSMHESVRGMRFRQI